MTHLFNHNTKNGLLLCSRYAAAPNFFGYCGPNKSTTLIDHLTDNSADREVGNILSEFETLFPYLELIAKKNHVLDPYDPRIVEAYWLGNTLQKPVAEQEYSAFLKERLSIDKKIVTTEFMNIRGAVDRTPFYPHHAFHVFNIFRRTGRDSSFHTLNTMDECRISWGKIEKITANNGNTALEVTYSPLKYENTILQLSKPVTKILRTDYKDKDFMMNVAEGDHVSFHWGFVCDKVSKTQVLNLDRFTRMAIDFYNKM